MPASDQVHFVSRRTSTKEKFDSGSMDKTGTAPCKRTLIATHWNKAGMATLSIEKFRY
jgi:hypothetical protein